MKTLSPNWLTEQLIDFEYKKYVLLAYLQSVREELKAQKLYPAFADLIFHYRNLCHLRDHKNLLYENFPQRISHADFERLQLVYKSIVEDDETMRIIEELVHYAIPLVGETLEEAREIYEHIEQQLEISPVGITPLNTDKGYMFLSKAQSRDTRIYTYHITIFEDRHERFRGIHTQYLETVNITLTQTYEHLKLSLARRFTHLPNPATFVIIAKVACPLEESLLPIARRALVKHISRMAA
ncbi:MAG: hypothetical protein RMJ87_09115 [Cytophagales bacterium]|nr:hypothetical protein [Bernardetiaceae bacterium]MDW8205174.1 hypothetical protein [Cytophagales bacterium]